MTLSGTTLSLRILITHYGAFQLIVLVNLKTETLTGFALFLKICGYCRLILPTPIVWLSLLKWCLVLSALGKKIYLQPQTVLVNALTVTFTKKLIAELVLLSKCKIWSPSTENRLGKLPFHSLWKSLIYLLAPFLVLFVLVLGESFSSSQTLIDLSLTNK